MKVGFAAREKFGLAAIACEPEFLSRPWIGQGFTSSLFSLTIISSAYPAAPKRARNQKGSVGAQIPKK